MKNPADRGGRRCRDTGALQLNGDRCRAGIQTLLGQVGLRAKDLASELVRRGAGVAVRACGSGFDGVDAAFLETRDEFMNPPPGHPVTAGGPALDSPWTSIDSTITRDFDTAHRCALDYEQCLDSYVNDFVNPRTLSPTDLVPNARLRPGFRMSGVSGAAPPSRSRPVHRAAIRPRPRSTVRGRGR